ncbi:glycosyltransferase family 2 protein [Brucellaceae bacterium C25G]
MPAIPDHITIFATSAGLDHMAVDTVITLPTFRRPDHVLKTLHSLNAQMTDRNFAIILVENEAEAHEGATAAAPLFLDGTCKGMIIVESARGNCNAYNAAWLTALHQFPNFKQLIVIDDDEIAAPNWLETMCQTKEHYQADLVGGPQVPVFENQAQNHWAKHPVFSPPYTKSGKVPVLYSSGNLLVSRVVLDKMPFPFLNLMFNFTGGGDSDFISRSLTAGFTTAWSAEAKVFETIPARRLEGDWIRDRGLRNGMLSTHIEKRKRASEPMANFKIFARSIAILGFSPVKALIKGLQAKSLAVGLYYIHVGLGRVAAHFGYNHEQYRNPEKN